MILDDNLPESITSDQVAASIAALSVIASPSQLVDVTDFLIHLLALSTANLVNAISDRNRLVQAVMMRDYAHVLNQTLRCECVECKRTEQLIKLALAPAASDLVSTTAQVN